MLHYRPPMILVSKLRVSHEEIDFLSTSEVLLIWTFSLIYPFYMYSSWLLVYFPSEVFPFLATHPNIELAYLCISCPRDFVAGWKAEPACKTSWFFVSKSWSPKGREWGNVLQKLAEWLGTYIPEKSFPQIKRSSQSCWMRRVRKAAGTFFDFPE